LGNDPLNDLVPHNRNMHDLLALELLGCFGW
jgi:hypothetical protein